MALGTREHRGIENGGRFLGGKRGRLASKLISLFVAIGIALPVGAHAQEKVRVNFVKPDEPGKIKYIYLVESGIFKELETGDVYEIKNGAYLPQESLITTGKEIARLKAENKALKAAPPVVLIIIGGIALLGTGYLIGKSLGPKK